MRKYIPKDDVQKKSYFNDRFYVAPQIPRKSVYDDSVFSNDLLSMQKKVEVLESYIEMDHLVMYVNACNNFEAIKHAKEILCYDFLIELSAIDFIADSGGFEIFYEMLSTSKHKRLRIKTFIKEDEEIQSVNDLFRAADFSEREMYDMYGVKLRGHPYPKRILMPDDWHDHPLRKTYPLHGDEAAQWYEVDKIFGREARDVIGPEIRDAAAIDRYDTQRFARLGHEVPSGVDIANGKEPNSTPLAYQEDGGVGLFGKKLVSEFDEKKSKTLDKRV